MAEWVEDLHPRDERGRWTFSNAGGYLVDDDDRKEIAKYKQPASETNVDKISAQERWAVNAYTKEYAKGITLNQKLRAGQPLDDQDLKNRDGLDSVIERSELKGDTLLYRFHGREASEKFSELEPGDLVTDPGFMSTTVTPWVFKGKPEETMQILAPKGSKVFVLGDDLSVRNEGEAIVARGSKLEFVGENDDGSRVFKLKQERDLNGKSQAHEVAPKREPSRVEQVQFYDKTIDVLINPTKEMAVAAGKKTKEFRWFSDKNMNFYYWDASRAIHNFVAKEVGVEEIDMRQAGGLTAKELVESVSSQYDVVSPILKDGNLPSQSIVVHLGWKRDESRPNDVEVLVNPRENEVLGLVKDDNYKEVRAVRDVNANVYVWSARLAPHYSIEAELRVLSNRDVDFDVTTEENWAIGRGLEKYHRGILTRGQENAKKATAQFDVVQPILEDRPLPAQSIMVSVPSGHTHKQVECLVNPTEAQIRKLGFGGETQFGYPLHERVRINVDKHGNLFAARASDVTHHELDFGLNKLSGGNVVIDTDKAEEWWPTRRDPPGLGKHELAIIARGRANVEEAIHKEVSEILESEKQKNKQTFGDVRVIGDDVTDKFVNSIKVHLKNLPPKLVQFIQSSPIGMPEVRAQNTCLDSHPMANLVDGAYHPINHTLTLYESPLALMQHSPEGSLAHEHTIVHEMMHAHDNITDASGDEKFRRAFFKDINTFAKGVSLNDRVRNERFTHEDSPDEAYAELGAHILLGNTKMAIQKLLPRTDKYLREKFKKDGLI